ncbi:MAG: hypothetical protein KIS76_15895 [Pyrinomonadaceae bacterium]|nr:hypothetical protein [Pyrinomonadaceae bacterium]
MSQKLLGIFLSILFFAVSIPAQQTADVTITLNEKFFDVLLEAVFTNLQNPSFPLAENTSQPESAGSANGLGMSIAEYSPSRCDESIRLMRQIGDVRTAVRFRDGRINAPIAFSGSYNPPLIGCLDFTGWADTTIELGFDQNSQTLIGRATVSDVRLTGTGGVGGGLIARMVQSSIDKKINPIRILEMDKVSFTVPVQNSGSLRMKAVGMRHEIVNGAMNVHITYQFLKG